jgi:hypothetical protein
MYVRMIDRQPRAHTLCFTSDCTLHQASGSWVRDLSVIPTVYKPCLAFGRLDDPPPATGGYGGARISGSAAPMDPMGGP